MRFDWNEDKNKLLRETRGFCFNDLINDGKYLGRELNKSSNHRGQYELHILYCNYVYKVPYVEQEDGTLFLKTAFKDGQLNKFYNKEKDKNVK